MCARIPKQERMHFQAFKSTFLFAFSRIHTRAYTHTFIYVDKLKHTLSHKDVL